MHVLCKVYHGGFLPAVLDPRLQLCLHLQALQEALRAFPRCWAAAPHSNCACWTSQVRPGSCCRAYSGVVLLSMILCLICSVTILFPANHISIPSLHHRQASTANDWYKVAVLRSCRTLFILHSGWIICTNWLVCVCGLSISQKQCC